MKWSGSRAVAAEKANTANAFSLKSFASNGQPLRQ